MQNYLIHYGVQGQKWGVRKYQNEDGSYKNGAEGRYAPMASVRRKVAQVKDAYKSAKDKLTSDETKRKLKTAAIVAGTAVALYGVHRISNGKLGDIAVDAINPSGNKFDKIRERQDQFFEKARNRAAAKADPTKAQNRITAKADLKRSRLIAKKINESINKTLSDENLNKIWDDFMKSDSTDFDRYLSDELDKALDPKKERLATQIANGADALNRYLTGSAKN